MALDPGRFIQDPMRLPVQAQQMIGDDDTGGESRGARSQPLAERNVVVDFERDGRQDVPDIGGYRQRSPPDQIVFASRNLRGIAATHANREALRALEPAGQIDSERQTEAIESGTEIGTGSWNA